MAKFVLEVHTIERTVVKEEVSLLNVPTPVEELTILPGHLPIITTLGEGTLRYNDAKGEQYLFISGGFMEVQPERVVILADLIERPEEIDEEEIEAAKKRAEDLRRRKEVDVRSLASAQADLNVALRKIKVIERHRHRR